MSERKETCGSCRYWDKGTTGTGLCRVKQPKVIVLGEDMQGNLLRATSWPETRKADWCGEWFRGASGG